MPQINRELLQTPEQKTSKIEALVRAHPEVVGLQAYEYFRSNITQEKSAFIADEMRNPELHYSRLTEEAIRPVAIPMEEALVSLLPGERDKKIDGLFNAIEYRHAELFMVVQALRMNDTTLAEEERVNARDLFVEVNEALYGAPEKPVFTALASREIYSQLERPLPERASRLQAELGKLIGKPDEATHEPFKPEQEAVDHIGSLLKERLGYLVDHIELDREYDVPSMVQALNVAIEKIGAVRHGWRAESTPDSTALTISAHKKLAEVGENRASLSGRKFVGKVFHEVGVHLMRCYNAEKAGWLSAAYGQEGYLDFEEALATALEDANEGKFVDHGVQYYVTAGLAYGLDNHAPRDFREVYEVMWRTRALKTAKNDEDVTDESIAKAKSGAYSACSRLFRGTTCDQPGVVYLKDLAYFKGQELAWSVLRNVRTQEDFDLLFAGKLDLTRPDHLEIAKEITSLENNGE